jgi:hypothetical protein
MERKTCKDCERIFIEQQSNDLEVFYELKLNQIPEM